MSILYWCHLSADLLRKLDIGNGRLHQYKKDAGDMRDGHTVTAPYKITPQDENTALTAKGTDPNGDRAEFVRLVSWLK